MPDSGFTTKEVARFAGVTERQLDHWSRVGIVSPNATSGAPGSGRRRRWDARARSVVLGLGGLARLHCPLEGMRATAEALATMSELPHAIVLSRAAGEWQLRPLDAVEDLGSGQWVVRLTKGEPAGADPLGQAEPPAPFAPASTAPTLDELEQRVTRVEAAIFRSTAEAQ